MTTKTMVTVASRRLTGRRGAEPLRAFAPLKRDEMNKSEPKEDSWTPLLRGRRALSLANRGSLCVKS